MGMIQIFSSQKLAQNSFMSHMYMVRECDGVYRGVYVGGCA